MNLFLNFFSEDATIDNFCEEFGKILQHVSPENCEKICVAVSGGSDSVALLILGQIVLQRYPEVKIFCVTVDHNLRAEALEEALFVKNLCDRLGVPHEILTWEHHSENFDHENVGKLENLAREARYRLISEFCAKNNIKLMLTGHTWNDQLETSEMRGIMGSGAVGLAGMSQIRSFSKNLKILRPLLHFSRDHLRNFLKNRGISWKNDPMNEMEEFLRVSLRLKIRNYNEDQLKNASQKIIDCGAKRHETERIAVNILKSAEFSSIGYASIAIDQLTTPAPEVRCEVLKRLIWNVGGKKYAPSISPLMLEQIFQKKINTIGRCLLKFKRNRLFIFREARNVKQLSRDSVTSEEILKFDDRFELKFYESLSNISVGPPQNFSLIKKFYEKNFPEVQQNAIRTLPCVYQNNKMIATLAPIGMIDLENNSYRISELFSCDFTPKPELFDVFL